MPLNLFIREAPLAAARDAVHRLRPGRQGPGRDQHLPRRHAAEELRRHPPRAGRSSTTTTSCAWSPTATSARCRRAADESDEFGAEPWFYVGPNDIFPEEFINFMGLGGELREAFLKAHGELLTPRYWNQIQARHRAGELLDIIPYSCQRRLSALHEDTVIGFMPISCAGHAARPVRPEDEKHGAASRPSCMDLRLLSSRRASATPGAGWPYSLAVTRARAARCRQRKAGRVAANSSVTVR